MATISDYWVFWIWEKIWLWIHRWCCINFQKTCLNCCSQLFPSRQGWRNPVFVNGFSKFVNIYLGIIYNWISEKFQCFLQICMLVLWIKQTQILITSSPGVLWNKTYWFTQVNLHIYHIIFNSSFVAFKHNYYSLQKSPNA